MIAVLELRERAREWSLREDVVEKDYVLGWLLWGIASEPALTDTWVFKGGTCLKMKGRPYDCPGRAGHIVRPAR